MSEPFNRAIAAWVDFVARVTPRCHDITRLLSESMERPLPWHSRLLIRLHFTVCVWCERYGQQMKHLRAFSRAFPEKGCEHGPATLSAGARERLARALHDEAKPPG